MHGQRFCHDLVPSGLRFFLLLPVLPLLLPFPFAHGGSMRTGSDEDARVLKA